MGTFVFKWPHAAEEVYVTGTFDDWSKSEKLEKVGDVFEKKVTLAKASEKIFYKFVVDGNWTVDHTASHEKDDKGNENNILKPEDIVKEATPETVVIGGVGPESTTAQLAGAVPMEKPEVPGGFPETPATELDKEFAVNPLPATDGAVNPIKLEPGEKIPESVAAEGVDSHVTLDKESYEKSDRLPGLETELPPVSKNLIPESSLPIATPQDVTINSVSAESTTAILAGKVPLEEPKVPEVVKESQEAAKVDPEASAISEEVKEKAAVEEELLEKVPEAPSTSEGTAGQGTDKSEKDKTVAETIVATTAVLGATAAGLALTAKETVVTGAAEVIAKLPEPVQAVIPAELKQEAAAVEKETKLETVSPEVPAEVKESIAEAAASPEAAANTVAVEEKKEVEAELLREVKPVEPVAGASVQEASSLPPKPETNGGEAVAPKPETNGGEDVTPKAVEGTAPPAATESAAPSDSVKPAAASPATAEKKKKNRLSAFFGKLKGKVGGSKDKA